MEPGDPNEKTLHDLQWARIADAVRSRCRSPTAAERVVPIAETIQGTRVALAETGEALALMQEGERLPVEGIRDIAPFLDRAEREGHLDGPALRDIRLVLGAAGALGRFLGRHRQRAPRLTDACGTDPTLDRLEEELGRSLEADGTLSDHASADLKRLRTEMSNLRGRLVGRLEQMIHSKADILSDRFYTIREGRYVLPLRTDAHEKLPGIVHGTSASGATVFVEPRGLIAQGNRLKMAQGELSREEARILGVLTDRVRERLHDVRAALAALLHADLRSAAARFGLDCGGRLLPLLDEPRVRLVQGRHPVLLLDEVDVVPNDVELSAGRGLVLSGPNAGGKTVALKMVGLTALMMRAGLPIPAGEGSECGFFHDVLTDVGDEQSLAKNLSTFSAHVTNLAHILDRAGRGAMVLLDELAGGTDPQEGAALACAVLDALCRSGAAVAVTTHYEALKAMGLRDERIRNASVGFDTRALAPTFELALDVPGASSALDIAARFGVQREVIDTARRVLPEHSRTFDELVRKLEDQRQAAGIEHAGLLAERRELANERAALERERAAFRRAEDEKLSREAERLLSAVRRARDDLREARRRLRDKDLEAKGLEDARRAAEEAERAAREAQQRAAPEESAEPHTGAVPRESELPVGARIWVPRLRAEAQVVQPPSRGRVRVAAGAMKLTVDVSDLRVLVTEETPPPVPASKPTPAPGAQKTRAFRTPDNTLDVRGLRVDEAVGMMESFVDRLYGASESVAYIVHGHGTGALRDAIRAHVERDETYVRKFRPGTRDEGGDAVTVVELR